MSEFGRVVLNPAEALELASYVIGMTKLADPNVGGDFQAIRVVKKGDVCLAIQILGEALARVNQGASDKRFLLQAFWYATTDPDVRKVMEETLKPLLEAGGAQVSKVGNTPEGEQETARTETAQVSER